MSTTLLCLYILKKVEIWSDVTIAGLTDGRTNQQGKTELLNQWTMDCWDEQKDHNKNQQKNKHVNCVVVTMVLGIKCNSSASHLPSSGTFCRFSLQIWFEFSFVQRRHRIGALGKGGEENHWVRRHAIIQSITTAYMLWMQIIPTGWRFLRGLERF